MKLNYDLFEDTTAWENAGIKLPEYNVMAMLEETETAPQWLHFGAGNIFRAYIAVLAQRMLNMGLTKSGIIAAESYDLDMVRDTLHYDNLSLLISLGADGSMEKEVIASIAKSIGVDKTQWKLPEDIFRNPSLQMVSFTITEKGYAVYGADGNYLPIVSADISREPIFPSHIMSIVTSLLYVRFQSGGTPIALVSMDNCSKNGDVLRDAIIAVAKGWHSNGFVPAEFIDYLSDEQKVSYPWSMIDKITPFPDEGVYRHLTELGLCDMQPEKTEKNSVFAPFVNAEASEYLVLEDNFPNSRPPLEKVGVYMTDKETVGKAEKMKVTTCLNPLHTALAIFGCLLGFTKISDEMNDPELSALVKSIGYNEGLPVVTDPKIISPESFLKEVLEKRFPNPFMPDTPQRIAADTSLKIPVRFGETIRAYANNPNLDISSLVYIPMVIAGWLRYLLAVDDEGNEMPLSPDPMLTELRDKLKDIKLSQPDTFTDQLSSILRSKAIFGSDLYEVGLGKKVEDFFREFIKKPGAVRKTLQKHLPD